MNFNTLVLKLKDAHRTETPLEAYITFSEDSFTNGSDMTDEERTFLLSSDRISRNSEYVTYFIANPLVQQGSDAPHSVSLDVYKQQNLYCPAKLRRSTLSVSLSGLATKHSGFILYHLFHLEVMAKALVDDGYFHTRKEVDAFLRQNPSISKKFSHVSMVFLDDENVVKIQG